MIKEFKNKYVSSLTQIHMSVVLHVVLIKVLATDPLEDVCVFRVGHNACNLYGSIVNDNIDIYSSVVITNSKDIG